MSRSINKSYITQIRKHKIFVMIRNNDLQALSQVSDDLSFLINEERLNQAFEEVNKSEE
jgi:hypothetical protein